ncbi:MAG: CocE/NonD family hydrolase, partial [Candidatus Thermoplasmatota archaeon]
MKSRALVLVALLATTALAGCISDQLGALRATDGAASLPTLDGNRTVLLRVPLTTKDGVKLDIVANMSQEAKDAGEKLPVIVDIGPYFSTNIMQYSAIDKRMADYFVPRGYVMARAALRGTGESGGCFDLGGAQEQKDVHDIVEWLGTQPWSNGNVAVFGKSYDGTTPWEAAITQPTHLKTIVPISGITDMYRYTFYDGTTYPEEVAF